MDRKRMADVRGFMVRTRTADELRTCFIELARLLRALPESQRAEPAPPVAVRVYNTGRERLKKHAPALAASLTTPPAAERTCTLGVVLARSMEIAAKLSWLPAVPETPAPAPVAAEPVKKAAKPKKPAVKRGKK